MNRRVTVGVLALSLFVGTAAAEADSGRRGHIPVQPVYVPVYVPPVFPYYVPPPPSYEFYYQQELQRLLQRPPEAPKSFEGSSPRCPRFFCESTR